MSRKRTSGGNCSEPDGYRIFWDTETTGISRCRIVSLGWISEDEEYKGELLMIPRVSIDVNAYMVHGYTREKLIECGAKETQEQLIEFMKQIESIPRLVILVAHNGKSFDTNVLRHELECENVKIANNIIGFVDSLHWIKWDLKLSIANLDHLMEVYLNKKCRDIHGAMEDSKLLKDVIVKLMKVFERDKLSYFESIEEFLIRTKKWAMDEEKIKDLFDEMNYKLQTYCIHETLDSRHDAYSICHVCGHWKLK